jgi:hypothetical protein
MSADVFQGRAASGLVSVVLPTQDHPRIAPAG